MSLDVAVCHWGVPFHGGGENVAFELARTLEAPLYTAEYDEDVLPVDVEVRRVFSGRRAVEAAIRLPFPLDLPGHVAGWATAHRLREHDVVVTSGNKPLFYNPGDGQAWVHYAHHTGRFTTDLAHTIDDTDPGARAAVYKKIDHALRFVQRHALSAQAEKPDVFAANSEVVADRLSSYWGVDRDDTEVVYPPVPVSEYGPGVAETCDYYVTVGRVDDVKRLSLLNEAFNTLGSRLLVAGTGGDLEDLRESAPANVTYLGYISEEKKRELLSEAAAFLIAAEGEDFGISPVEALASGTPVIGVDEGFTRHQIRHGKNGYLVEPTPHAFRDAVHRFERESVEWDEARIAESAERFSTERFRSRVRSLVEETAEAKQAARTPHWATGERQ